VSIHLQVVNFGNQAVDLNISVAELATGVKKSGSKQTVLTSSSPLDENSFQQPEKVGARRTESVGSACSGLYITDSCVCVCVHAGGASVEPNGERGAADGRFRGAVLPHLI
jgi:hypothetical protein